MRLLAAAVAALTAVCAGLLASAQPSSAATFVPIVGAGSTWSYNAIHDWTNNVAQIGMQVNYQPDGSTNGRSDFRQGLVDWAASDIPYGVRDGSSYDPPPNRGYAYMPDTAGATTFMYNLSIGGRRVTGLRLSGRTIAAIFTGVITLWNDRMIAADNPGLKLPAIRVVPVVRTDGSGVTADFTQWMAATRGSYWNAYCQKVGRNPCTPTSTYPVLPGSGMVGQSGDTGVAGYVSQSQADGAIGYVEYSYALETGFPVAKVLNAAGYYTAPTAGHVAVSLLKAQINMNQSDPLYLTHDLSQVYTDTDPRTYELSSYSYMIIPTGLSYGMTTAKGYTLGAFGEYLLCQGQQRVDALGYSALPINLVEAGFAQLQKIPGAQVPTATTAIIQSCHNPTFSTDGTNTLANTDPYPPACDKRGSAMCGTAVTTRTAVTSSANPATVGHPVTFTATVSPAPAGGTVRFTDHGAPVPRCQAAPVSRSRAACTVTYPAAGTHSIVATYSGTSGFAASASAAKTLTVAKAATRTALSLSATRVTFGHEQSERLTVTVTPQFSGTPGGKVTIKTGRTTVCTITLASGKGHCTLAPRQLRRGTYRLIATYPGSSNFTGSASARKTLVVK
jgi:phosphate ABC transporter phosphate-binding protein